jgi:uncharacterized membrane protein YedE/YeeE
MAEEGAARTVGGLYARRLPGAQGPVWLAAAAGIAIIAMLAAETGGWRLGAGALLGALGGFALYHASFGFTSAWRSFILTARGGGVRAQLLLVALIILVSFPLIGWPGALGLTVSGYIFPFGVAAAIGAFIFGLGMQLGGGCGSGTLYTVGGGSTRMVLTLAAFIAGSVLATTHWDAWQTLPKLPPLSLIWSAGAGAGLAIALVALAALAWGTMVWERRRHGEIEGNSLTLSLLQGPWSRATGAIVLAVMAIGTLIILGRPWGITSAFALWGAKVADTAGIDVASWSYWKFSPALQASVFADATSVQDFGIMLGAMMAAGLAGRFAPVWRIGVGPALAAILGGLLMGYGARLAFGCNIGALLGGLTSGSLHGLGWLVFGFIGSVAGVRLRPYFNLD